jgi:hypothetical protein
MTSAALSAVTMRPIHLLTGASAAAWSISLAACLPTRRRGVSCTMAMTGTDDFSASKSPVTRFVAPGPVVAAHTPGRPVAFA